MNAKASAPRWSFTVAEYHRMGEAGIFNEDDRVELIEGEIVAMSPIGSRHAACVDRIASLLRDRVTDMIVRVQNPVRLSDDSEPQPDLSLVRACDDFYAGGHPKPEDVRLLIEVADASVMYDRNTKIPLYARSGIPEVWLVDLVTNVVEVHSTPAGNAYSQMQRFARGATVASAQVPDLRMAAAELLIG
jgi:Uma2 family endonuclease